MASKKMDKNIIYSLSSKGKRTIPLLLCLIFLVCSTLLLVTFKSWRFVNPFTPYDLENVSSATMDKEGNLYVIVSSGEDVLKISPEGVLEKRYSGKDYGFTGATHIAFGGDGKIYVHTVEYSEGVRIASEQIISLSEVKAETESTATRMREEGAMRQSLIALMGTDDGIYFFELVKDELRVQNQQRQVVKKVVFSNQQRYIISATYDKDKGILYYSTYDGKVFKYAKDEPEKEIYNSIWEEGSNPQDLAIKEGKLYCTDVGIRDVIVFDPEDDTYERVSEEADYEDRSIAPMISASEGGLVTASESDVFVLRGTVFEAVDAPALSQYYVFVAVLGWIALAVFALSIATIALFFIIYVVSSSNSSMQISIGIVVVVVGIGALFLGTLFPSFQEQFENEIFVREQFAARSTLAKIDKESLGKVTKPSDYMSDAYLDIKESASEIFLSGEADSLYCMIYRRIGDEVYIIYTLEDLYAAYPSDYTPEDLEDLEKDTFVRLKSSTSQGNYLYVQIPITDEADEIVGFLEVGTETSEIDEKNAQMLRDLIINVVAMTVVIILFALELISFISCSSKINQEPSGDEASDWIPPEIYRFIVFLIFFFTNLTCAILPIYAMKIAGSLHLFGLSSEFLAAIPISAEVFSGALFSAIGGGIIRKLGTKKSVVLSSLLFTLGLAVRIVPNLWTLTLGALILGAGWGIQLLMVNVLIARLPEKEKDRGYSYYNIASLAGANCAVVLGGFLVQWVNYEMLFSITAFSSIFLFVVSNRYLVYYKDTDTEDDANQDEHAKVANPVRFVFSPKVISFFVFMLIPLLIGGYFLYYMFPIIGSEWGLSDTYIGYAYVLNGLVAALIGNRTTDFFSHGNLKPIGLFLAVLMYAGAFSLVASQGTVVSLLIALVILGVADSFGIPLLTNYYTDLKEVEAFGYDRALGVYSLFENGAQSLGSYVFGIVLTMGVTNGLRTVLFVMLILSVLFLLSISFKSEKGVTANEEEN